MKKLNKNQQTHGGMRYREPVSFDGRLTKGSNLTATLN